MSDPDFDRDQTPGWHNKHRADPRSADHGRRWFELDPGFAMIRAMEAPGLESDVISPGPRSLRDEAPACPHRSTRR